LKKVKKYYYNANTHKFEKFEIPLKQRLVKLLGFVSATIVTGLIFVAIVFRFLDSPKEKLMGAQLKELKEQYASLQHQVNTLNSSLEDLENRDNNIYRTVFESAPLPDSIRKGKNYSRINPAQVAYMPTDEMIASVNNNISNLRKRIDIQRLSYDTLEHMVQSKQEMLSAIPAIQPISNKSLERLASGFGYRIDPIYKTPKMHTGLDFTAALGTPIYATGDGRVTTASFDNGGGYGYHVVIKHGYGYETLYGHMVRVKVRNGEQVKRGQVIGWVGSTGKSTGPHCHYEVIKNNEKINPINFFFNDLTAAEYERLTRIAAASNQSFD
jgi:murein DD-endopeptidase MepM/ murein hydrolase activator NlpD